MQICAILSVVMALLGAAAAKPPVTNPCSMRHSVAITDYHLFVNGSLLDNEEKQLYQQGMYFQDGDRGYRGCICKIKPCVRKCCDKYMHYNNSLKCDMNAEGFEFRPAAFDLATLEPSIMANANHEHFGYIYGELKCKLGKYRLEPDLEPIEDRFFLLSNGSLHMPAFETSVDVEEFCIDYFADKGAILPLLCFPDPDAGSVVNTIVFTMFPIGMLLSTVFMALTLVVYGLLPELRNLHGKCLMCHVACLLMAYLSLSIIQLGTSILPEWMCTFLPYAIQFTFCAAFFWLNIMCFDICWMFNRVRTISGSNAERERKKMIIYSLYAWTCPLVLLIIVIVVEFVSNIPDFVPRPNFGLSTCWYNTAFDKSAVFTYFFGPISVLLLCNLVLFTVTAVRIIKIKKETAVLTKHADSQRSDNKEKQQNFLLYLKLFLVMGMTWIMEVVSVVVGGSSYMWILTDVCNTLQGLAIFLIFVWKPKVRRLLRVRMAKKRQLAAGETHRSGLPSAIGTSKRNDFTVDSSTSYNSDGTRFKPVRPATQTASTIIDEEESNLRGHASD